MGLEPVTFGSELDWTVDEEQRINVNASNNGPTRYTVQNTGEGEGMVVAAIYRNNSDVTFPNHSPTIQFDSFNFHITIALNVPSGDVDIDAYPPSSYGASGGIISLSP